MTLKRTEETGHRKELITAGLLDQPEALSWQIKESRASNCTAYVHRNIINFSGDRKFLQWVVCLVHTKDHIPEQNHFQTEWSKTSPHTPCALLKDIALWSLIDPTTVTTVGVRDFCLAPSRSPFPNPNFGDLGPWRLCTPFQSIQNKERGAEGVPCHKTSSGQMRLVCLPRIIFCGRPM